MPKWRPFWCASPRSRWSRSFRGAIGRSSSSSSLENCPTIPIGPSCFCCLRRAPSSIDTGDAGNRSMPSCSATRSARPYPRCPQVIRGGTGPLPRSEAGATGSRDRGSQITFFRHRPTGTVGRQTGMGTPIFTKRKRLQAALASPCFPTLPSALAGSTSIDITTQRHRQGIRHGEADNHLGAFPAAAEMVFIGDALYPGGNDYAVHEGRHRHDRCPRRGRNQNG